MKIFQASHLKSFPVRLCEVLLNLFNIFPPGIYKTFHNISVKLLDKFTKQLLKKYWKSSIIFQSAHQNLIMKRSTRGQPLVHLRARLSSFAHSAESWSIPIFLSFKYIFSRCVLQINGYFPYFSLTFVFPRLTRVFSIRRTRIKILIPGTPVGLTAFNLNTF